ncbi:glycosyltransferase family 8 protein [Candidatus Enterococcus murrayae]|uniref:Glycosyltransferase family 8 protein n=1 Tax=Candidatus Enterococcus murrayae TaxID=2815321 RepID=A0ABS3HFY3_9ENTE|nr:glycosyltransferase family 8 protein [Enterococcus sp. MJM16]MBO0451859.1 glycosyltransferase family 8 protein [Enterococcus sp. MJM16]
MAETIDILITLDENYLEPLHIMLTSLHVNNPAQDFTIWLIHERIPDSKLQQLNRLLAQWKMTFHEIKVPMELFSNAPTVERYPKEMYFRLASGKLLPNTVKKVVYLDPDTLIINPLNSLWDFDLNGNMLGAATHAGLTNLTEGFNNIRLGTDHGYYNSGVMLMDMEKVREIVQLEDIFKTIHEFGDYLLLPDQDILNFLYGKYIKEIPEEIWNYDTRKSNVYLTKSLGKHNSHWVAKNTVVLHYCGKPKPWDEKSNNRFTLLYAHYQQLLKRYNDLLS